MSQQGSMPKTIVTTENIEKEQEDISSFLEKYSLPFITLDKYLYTHVKPEGPYFEVYITAVQSQLTELFDIVLPEISKWGIPARLPVSRTIAKRILSGHHGSSEIGKIITLYFNTHTDALNKTNQLTTKLNGINGPAVQNMLCLAPNIYGPFNPAVPHAYNSPTVHKNRFKPLKTLKNDVKGLVVKGYLVKGFLRFCTCILKQGKKYMWSDKYGRHMHHRLHWQYEVHEDLKDTLLLPAVYLYRENNDETLLVMQFIKGKSLANVVSDLYKERCWGNLTVKEKNYLLALLGQVLTLVEKLHYKGYVHRDLTPANFMLNGKNKMYLLDFELAYHTQKEFPFPPFDLGTPGYMSPEQLKILKPDYPEDIYTLGALMVKLFTNLHPAKFKQQDTAHLENQLFWFINDLQMAQTITACFNQQPETRPTIAFIIQSIANFRMKIEKHKVIQQTQWNKLPLSHRQLKELIERTYHRLVADPMDKENVLFGTIKISPTGIGHMELLEAGMGRTISALLLLLNHTKERNSHPGFKQFIGKKIEQHPELFMPPPNETLVGLFSGSAGSALTVHLAIQAEVVPPDSNTLNYLEQCFVAPATDLTILSGVAGQGIALLLIRKGKHNEFATEKMFEYTNTIISAQLANGSWMALNTSKKPALGLLNGMAGIVFFLLLNYSENQDQDSKIAANKGLQFLIKQSSLKKCKRTWPSIASTNYSLANGMSGMAIVFLLAYEAFKTEEYKMVAESVLNNFPSTPVISDYSLLTGMAGMGLTLLQATKSCSAPKWMEQAEWIAQLFYNTFRFIGADKGLWNTKMITNFDPSLLTGFTGILWFMEEYQKAMENKA